MNPMVSQGARNVATGSMRTRPNFSGDVVPKGYRTGQLQQYTPEQLQLFGQLFPFLGEGSYLQRLAGGDESLFQEMEAPAQRQFASQLGGIANRFAGGTGRGSLGTLRSSGFQNTASAHAANFAQELAANRQNLQRQGIRDLFELSNLLLGQKPYDRFLTEKQQKQPSGWGSLAGGLAGGIGGAFFGQPVAGAQFGSALGSFF